MIYSGKVPHRMEDLRIHDDLPEPCDSLSAKLADRVALKLELTNDLVELVILDWCKSHTRPRTEETIPVTGSHES